MAVKYIKKAAKTPETDDHKTQAAVQDILNDIATVSYTHLTLPTILLV